MFESSVIKIIFLLFPGVIATYILQLSNKKKGKYSQEHLCMYSIIFSIISYLIFNFFLFVFEINSFHNMIEILLNNDTVTKLEIRDFIWPIFIGVVLGILAILIKTRGWLNTILIKLKISNEPGFTSVLSTIYNQDNEYYKSLTKRYICIKLLDGSAEYYAELDLYEEHEGYIEVGLYQPNITLKGKEPYDQPYVYLTLANGTYHIEYYEQSPWDITPEQ